MAFFLFCRWPGQPQGWKGFVGCSWELFFMVYIRGFIGLPLREGQGDFPFLSLLLGFSGIIPVLPMEKLFYRCLAVFASLVLVFVGTLFWLMREKDPVFTASNQAVHAKMLSAPTGTKPALLIFSAEWCGPCKMMKKDIYPDGEVQATREKTEWVYYDVDSDIGREAAGRFKVNLLPTHILVDPTGVEKSRMVGGVPKKELLALLSQ
jgi:thioredoxin-related protein